MDLRVAVALLPDGKCLLNVEVRPADVDREAVAELRRRVEALDRPPVRGPVAFLLHSLVWGGSDNLMDSFRHFHAPQFRNEYPAEFAAAEAAYAAARPKKGFWIALKDALKLKARALYRAFVPAPPPPRQKSEGVPPEERTLEKLTQKIQTSPDWAAPYFWRAVLHQQKQHFEAAAADYSEFIARARRYGVKQPPTSSADFAAMPAAAASWPWPITTRPSAATAATPRP